MRLIDVDAIPDIEFLVCDAISANGELDAYCRGMDKVMEVVKSMPTIEVPQWIPCSERLPEKYGNYLVTTDDGEVDIGSCDPENKDRQDHFWSGCDADGFFWYGENIVISWMPLPEGYRGEQNEIDNCYQID